MSYKDNIICFLHIPKTGGKTLVDAFHRIETLNNITHHRAGSKGFLDNFSFDYFKNLEESKNRRIYSGHFVFGEDCKKTKLYTVIRDVHEMFFSNLYFMFFTNFPTDANKKNIEVIKKKLNVSLSFQHSDIDCIKKLLDFNFITSNIITKTLAGIPYEKFFFVAEDYKINDNDYNIAVKNLQYFDAIGNTASLFNFIKNFFSTNNLKLNEYTSQNISNYNRKFIKSISERLYKPIKKYNLFDYKIYNKITEIFN